MRSIGSPCGRSATQALRLPPSRPHRADHDRRGGRGSPRLRSTPYCESRDPAGIRHEPLGLRAVVNRWSTLATFAAGRPSGIDPAHVVSLGRKGKPLAEQFLFDLAERGNPLP
jgi:hypothetical protein